jgi:hypothetical protein
MMETYEAVYEDGRLEWLETPPLPGRCRVLVTVLEELPQHSPEEVQQVLDETRGTWGTGTSLDEVDRDIEAMRETWNRPWYEE